MRDRHTAGVPFSPGYTECLEYIGRVGIQDWESFDRERVWSYIPFINSDWWSSFFSHLFLVFIAYIFFGVDFAVQLLRKFVRGWILASFRI